MEVEWHPIKSEKDMPRRNRWVLVTRAGVVDVAQLQGIGGWTCYPAPAAWAELPKPYKKPKK